MKAPALLIGIFLLVLNQLAAQFSDIEATELALRRVANIRNAQQSNNRYANAQGSPFLYEDWRSGRLLLKGQDSIQSEVLINLDLVSELVLVKLRDGSTGMISPFSIQKVEIQGQAYLYRTFVVETEHRLLENSNNRPVFCEVLYNGNLKLLRRIHKRMYQPYATPYTISDGHWEIATIEMFWLQKADGKDYHRLKLNRRSIEKALPAHKNHIRQLSKQHQLDLTQLPDLVRLMSLLDKI